MIICVQMHDALIQPSAINVHVTKMATTGPETSVKISTSVRYHQFTVLVVNVLTLRVHTLAFVRR